MPKRLERAIGDGKMVVRAYTQKELDLMDWILKHQDYNHPDFDKYFNKYKTSRGIYIYPRTDHFVSYDNEFGWCEGWEALTGFNWGDYCCGWETDLTESKILKNAGTKDMTFLDDPEELDIKSKIIWIARTNLIQPEYNLKYNVWLFNLTNDNEHYAVVTDVGNCWWHWDGTIVAKKDVIILKEDE